MKIQTRIWSVFNSLKLTLTVLITLAVVSIIGTVIEQNKDVTHYVEAYGEVWTTVIQHLKLDDMYHSWWFTFILVILVFNITVCTLDRFPAKWKTLLKPSRPGKPRKIENFRNNYSFTSGEGFAAIRDAIVRTLKKRGYKVEATEADAPGGVHTFHAWKGKAGRFGSDITHVSLLVILLGSILGSIYGYKDFSAIYEGGSVKVPEADFTVRLDKFWIEYYDTGEIRQFFSNLTVLEDEVEVLKKKIWVNEPLYYKGIRFYQSSYGMAWDRVREVELRLKDNRTEETGEVVEIEWLGTGRFPGTPYSAKVVAYVADFAFDEKTKTIYSRSADPDNPALQVEVYKDGEYLTDTWVFFNYPGLFAGIEDNDYTMLFTGFRKIPYSGLSITKDPGTNVVWLGTIIMGIGFTLAFFVFYKRIWINVSSSGRSHEVSLGGMVNKNNLSFKKEFQELAGEIDRECGGPGSEDKR